MEYYKITFQDKKGDEFYSCIEMSLGKTPQPELKQTDQSVLIERISRNEFLEAKVLSYKINKGWLD